MESTCTAVVGVSEDSIIYLEFFIFFQIIYFSFNYIQNCILNLLIMFFTSFKRIINTIRDILLSRLLYYTLIYVYVSFPAYARLFLTGSSILLCVLLITIIFFDYVSNSLITCIPDTMK